MSGSDQPQSNIPYLGERLALTDGGLETTLIFHEGWDLPEFAAFVLLDSSPGREALRRYYDRYIAIAATHQTDFVLETPTWRASKKWGALLGYNDEDIDIILSGFMSAVEVELDRW